jgi:hypothetical protein
MLNFVYELVRNIYVKIIVHLRCCLMLLSEVFEFLMPLLFSFYGLLELASPSL